LAAEKGNFKVLHKIFDWSEKKLTAEEMNNKLLLGTDIKEIRLVSSNQKGSFERFQILWNLPKKKLQMW